MKNVLMLITIKQKEETVSGVILKKKKWMCLIVCLFFHSFLFSITLNKWFVYGKVPNKNDRFEFVQMKCQFRKGKEMKNKNQKQMIKS